MTPTHPTQASVGEVRHTPGPWLANWEDGDFYVSPQDDFSLGLCQLMPIDAGGDKDYFYGSVTNANARLIAAAPDLLEALQALIDMDVAYKRGPVVEEAVERARAAIARATSLPNEAHDE